jgi:hypothetical protein
MKCPICNGYGTIIEESDCKNPEQVKAFDLNKVHVCPFCSGKTKVNFLIWIVGIFSKVSLKIGR